MIVVKKFSIYILLISALSADCKVDYSIMYVIAQSEKHLNRDVGYPFLISFNDSKDAKKIKKTTSFDWLDTRTIDCHNQEQCEIELQIINQEKIANLDLGAYQINHRWFKYNDKSKYFNLKKSYEQACQIVYSHYSKDKEWNWERIARYHSKTSKYNKRYARVLQNNYSKLITNRSELPLSKRAEGFPISRN